MARQPQKVLEKISVLVPQKKADKNVMARLHKLGDKKDRSVNYMVVEAIIQYLDREEKKA